MGGEKWPVLVYGSTERNELRQWILKFSLVDVHKFAEEYRMENICDDDEHDESIFLSHYEIEYEDSERLIDFVLENDLIMVYFDTKYWDEFSIGMEVPDSNNLTDEEKERVFKFCEKYGMSKPKMYAGIVGEFE
jgi:hypothetical protein